MSLPSHLPGSLRRCDADSAKLNHSILSLDIRYIRPDAASDSEYLRTSAHRAIRNVYSEAAFCYADRIEPDIAVNHGTIGAPFRAAFWIAPGYSRRGMQVNLLRVNQWMADIYHFFGSAGVDSGCLRK